MSSLNGPRVSFPLFSEMMNCSRSHVKIDAKRLDEMSRFPSANNLLGLRTSF